MLWVELMSQRPDISIIGPGKVGTALGILARRAGYNVAAVGGRNAESAAQAAKTIGAGAEPMSIVEAARAGDLVVIAVPDNAIAAVAGQLASASAVKKDAVVVHCSGALESSILAPLKESFGCAAASMHPLQTFPSVESAVEKLPGAYFFCEGDEGALESVRLFVEAVGGHYVQIHPQAKGLYHAAAVTACNYLVTLMDASVSLAQAGGVDRDVFLKALGPIVRATVDNVISQGPQKVLTGPVARGDVEILTRHLEAIKKLKEEYRIVYTVLGMQTVYLALQNGYIDSKTATKMMDKLSD